MSVPSSSGTIIPIAMCEWCLQYLSDCECCRFCDGVDGHEHGCEGATTRRQSVVVMRPRRIVVRIDEVDGAESTGKVIMFRPTLRSPGMT